MSNRVWGALGVGLMALFGAQFLKAKQEIDDKEKGISPEARSFAAKLNTQLTYTRSLRIPGALTRPEMDPDGEVVRGWSKAINSTQVLKETPMETVRQMCLDMEDYYKRFDGSIFCGWVVKEIGVTDHDRYWSLRQTVFFKVPQTVQG